MGLQESLWNIAMSHLVTPAASVYEIACG